MRFENHFDVGAPIAEVWGTVLDVERVAPTVPGAQVLERVSDDAYKVAIKVKVGPMSMTYRGEVEITERDETEHRAVMKARAKESRGQGTADADVTMSLAGHDGGTAATVVTDVQLSGKVASMGQGVLQDVSRRLVETFAANLATMLEQGAQLEAEVPTQPTREQAPEPAPATATAAREYAAQEQAASVAPESALDLGSLGGAVIAERLSNPRILAPLLGIVALLAFLAGRRSKSG